MFLGHRIAASTAVDASSSAWTDIFGCLSLPVRTIILQSMPPSLPYPVPTLLRDLVMKAFQFQLGSSAEWEYESLIRARLFIEQDIETEFGTVTYLSMNAIHYAQIVSDGGIGKLLEQEVPCECLKTYRDRLRG